MRKIVVLNFFILVVVLLQVFSVRCSIVSSSDEPTLLCGEYDNRFSCVAPHSTLFKSILQSCHVPSLEWKDDSSAINAEGVNFLGIYRDFLVQNELFLVSFFYGDLEHGYSQLGVKRSTDSGLSFTNTLRVAQCQSSSGCTNVKLSASKDASLLLLCWSEHTENYTFFCSTSTDKGTTWTAPTVVSEDLRVAGFNLKYAHGKFVLTHTNTYLLHSIVQVLVSEDGVSWADKGVMDPNTYGNSLASSYGPFTVEHPEAPRILIYYHTYYEEVNAIDPFTGENVTLAKGNDGDIMVTATDDFGDTWLEGSRPISPYFLEDQLDTTACPFQASGALRPCSDKNINLCQNDKGMVTITWERPFAEGYYGGLRTAHSSDGGRTFIVNKPFPRLPLSPAMIAAGYTPTTLPAHDNLNVASGYSYDVILYNDLALAGVGEFPLKLSQLTHGTGAYSYPTTPRLPATLDLAAVNLNQSHIFTNGRGVWWLFLGVSDGKLLLMRSSCFE